MFESIYQYIVLVMLNKIPPVRVIAPYTTPVKLKLTCTRRRLDTGHPIRPSRISCRCAHMTHAATAQAKEHRGKSVKIDRVIIELGLVMGPYVRGILVDRALFSG